MALTDKDREILDFEGSWWTHQGPKAPAIRAHLGLAPTIYYRRLGALVDEDDAKAYAPLVVQRLRRRRSERRKERFEGLAEPQRPHH
jgi:hypothetical protein